MTIMADGEPKGDWQNMEFKPDRSAAPDRARGTVAGHTRVGLDVYPDERPDFDTPHRINEIGKKFQAEADVAARERRNKERAAALSSSDQRQAEFEDAMKDPNHRAIRGGPMGAWNAVMRRIRGPQFRYTNSALGVGFSRMPHPPKR